MNIKEILKRHGLDGEVVDTIAETINAEIPKSFVSKQQYSKKVGQIDELQNTIADLEAKVANTNADEYKVKYEEEVRKFEDYVNKIEKDKLNGSKRDLLRKNFSDAKINDKVIDLIMKGIDLDGIEIEENSIKGFDELLKGYEEFIPQESNPTGVPPLNPPTGGGGARTYTKDDINNMSADEINANWESISQSLNIQ